MTISVLFPQKLKIFLSEIEEMGFLISLVGGAVRDYLTERTFLSKDLDFELRNLSLETLKNFFEKKQIQYLELPYKIIKISLDEFNLEFSTPRIEKPLKNNKSHHYFEAILDQKLDYTTAFKRRDFTINAIAVEFNFKGKTEKIIDPYEGILALQNKTLKEVSADFSLDPVRFLRMIRFMIKYHYSISNTLEQKISEFDLRELSSHHFIEEMMKSEKPGIFINGFNNLVQIYHLEIPEKFNFLRTLKYLADIQTKEDLLVDTFLQNEKSAFELNSFLLFPEKKIKNLKSFHESINNLARISREDFSKLAQTPLDKVKDLTILKDLKNLEEKKEWKKYSNDFLLITWKDWENIQITEDEIKKISDSLRSYLRFYKALRKVFLDG